MASAKERTLIDAPVRTVWDVLVDPGRAPDWDEEVIAVTGPPVKIEAGSTFDVTSRGPLKFKATTTFKVVELEDMHEIKMQCQRSGYYIHWLLTPAQGETFAQLEVGVEPLPGLSGRAMAAMHTTGYLRKTAEKTVNALRRAIGREQSTAA